VSPPPPILRVAGVTKTYPGRFGRTSLTAVRDVSFDVHPGEILGLLGPNGAGKSTTLKMVTGLLRPTAGHITIAGVDVADRRSTAVRRLGAVLEGNRNLHWKLTARENLRYFGALKGVDDLTRRIDGVIDQLGLAPHLAKRVGELSRGLQQRVAIGVALLGEPQVLVLDEPTLGLDVIAGAEFQAVVRGIADRGCAIVLTTHQMEVAEALSQRIAIIAGGRLAALDSLSSLRGAYRSPGYEVALHGALPPATWAAIAAAGGEGCVESGALTTFRVPGGDPAVLYRAMEPLRDAAVELAGIRQQEVDLEGVYRRVVGEAGA
jgi:ABC-2 type transport system ATP-binding protein